MSKPDIYDECATAMQASKAWPAVFDAGSARLLAIAVIAELRRRGMVNELGIEAFRIADGKDGRA